jgi:signal transduction histidine kinase
MEALEKLAQDPSARWNMQQRQWLSSVQDQFKHIAAVNDSIQPLTVGQNAPGTNSANLNGLLRQAVNRFLPLAQTHNLALTTDLPQEIILAAAHPAQVAQVLDSLISNAIRFSNTGGRIWVHLEQTTEKTALVCISDNGRGLNAQQTARIFEAGFEPEKNQPQRFGGLGIHLNLAREIVLRFNGKIWVETKLNQGSRFYFTLPMMARQEG